MNELTNEAWNKSEWIYPTFLLIITITMLSTSMAQVVFGQSIDIPSITVTVVDANGSPKPNMPIVISSVAEVAVRRSEAGNINPPAPFAVSGTTDYDGKFSAQLPKMGEYYIYVSPDDPVTVNVNSVNYEYTFVYSGLGPRNPIDQPGTIGICGPGTGVTCGGSIWLSYSTILYVLIVIVIGIVAGYFFGARKRHS